MTAQDISAVLHLLAVTTFVVGLVLILWRSLRG